MVHQQVSALREAANAGKEMVNSWDHQFPRGTVEDTALAFVIVALGPCASL